MLFEVVSCCTLPCPFIDLSIYIGSNKEGQIGLGDSVERINILERIKSPPEFTTAKIAKIFCAPLHSIFITTDNHIYICGNNGNCRLGLGEKSSDMSKKRMPTRITEPEAFVQEKIIHVACGENHTLFLAGKCLHIFAELTRVPSDYSSLLQRVDMCGAVVETIRDSWA